MPGNIIGRINSFCNKNGVTREVYFEKINAGFKWCYSCKAWFNKTSFYKDVTRYDLLSPKCITCSRVKIKVNLKGRVSNFKNKRHSDETKAKMSRLRIASGRVGAPGKRFGKALENIRLGAKKNRLKGSIHPNWNNNLSDTNQRIRNGFEFINWRNEVFKRDNYTCQNCGSKKGGNLNAHHIQPFATFPELRFVVDNGVTLCKTCHKAEHKNLKPMGKETSISWADSSLNLQMGCEGCELVKGNNRDFPKCYAKIMTDRYGGKNSGFPEVFEKPVVFMERLKKLASWKDLTGTERADKPWLNGLPRIIFLNDMGDTFSNGMPENWFAEALPVIEKSPHVFMLLTKWPHRMAKFSEKFPFPRNVWPGVTVTSQKTQFRAQTLDLVTGGGVRWVSVEPMWSQIKFLPTSAELFIYGGESGSTDVTKFNCNWLYDQILFCDRNKKKCFIKQLGSNAFLNSKPLGLENFHGADWLEWPEQFQIREFPKSNFSSLQNSRL
jgi:protein gp37